MFCWSGYIEKRLCWIVLDIYSYIYSCFFIIHGILMQVFLVWILSSRFTLSDEPSLHLTKDSSHFVIRLQHFIFAWTITVQEILSNWKPQISSVAHLALCFSTLVRYLILSIGFDGAGSLCSITVMEMSSLNFHPELVILTDSSGG